MSLINDLRELAEDLYVNGYNRYSAAMSQAADEIESLQRYRTAFNEWIDKTEWLQKSLPAKYLGMHRADALKDLISELFDRLEAAKKNATELEERCAKWEAVFGHLGDTPDECGNAIIAARDKLENRCAELAADKGTWYRMSEVFSKRITEVEEALKTSEERCATLTDTLRLIAETDPIDAALDPQRAVRVAKAALEESK